MPLHVKKVVEPWIRGYTWWTKCVQSCPIISVRDVLKDFILKDTPPRQRQTKKKKGVCLPSSEQKCTKCYWKCCGHAMPVSKALAVEEEGWARITTYLGNVYSSTAGNYSIQSHYHKRSSSSQDIGSLASSHIFFGFRGWASSLLMVLKQNYTAYCLGHALSIRKSLLWVKWGLIHTVICLAFQFSFVIGLDTLIWDLRKDYILRESTPHKGSSTKVLLTHSACVLACWVLPMHASTLLLVRLPHSPSPECATKSSCPNTSFAQATSFGWQYWPSRYFVAIQYTTSMSCSKTEFFFFYKDNTKQRICMNQLPGSPIYCVSGN